MHVGVVKPELYTAMARTIANDGVDWRVRLSSGEYELTLEELKGWIGTGRVTAADLVRPPTTKRWKRAENASELISALDERLRKESKDRWAREEPYRKAAVARVSRQNYALFGLMLAGGLACFGLFYLRDDGGVWVALFGLIVGLLFALPLLTSRRKM